jgi:hypothetical protein
MVKSGGMFISSRRYPGHLSPPECESRGSPFSWVWINVSYHKPKRIVIEIEYGVAGKITVRKGSKEEIDGYIAAVDTAVLQRVRVQEGVGCTDPYGSPLGPQYRHLHV